MAGSHTEHAFLDRIGGPGWRRYVGQAAQVGGVRLVELGDGPGRGVRVLEFRNAVGFALDVVVDRAFDLGRCDVRGTPIAWVSPVGVRHPGLAVDEHLGWLRSFGGGLLATAGLDHIMFPETDEAGYFAYPPKQTADFPLHGRLSAQPARLLGYGLDEQADSGPLLWAEGEVTQAAVFGEVLTVRRRVEVPLGTPTVRLSDTVTNAGHVPVPHMLLYHVNLGWPLLDEGARLRTNAVSVTPRGEHPVEDFATMTGPRRGAVEEVYQLGFDGDEGLAALVNERLGLAVVERFATAAFPHLFVWRMLAEGTYVLGVEPSTNGPEGRAAAREAGALRVLSPGEQAHYGVELRVCDDLDLLPGIGLPDDVTTT